MMIQDLSLEKIRESPSLSDENWVKINKPDVYQKIISLPVSFFSNERKGDLISRMTSDINSIKTAFMSVLMMVSEPLTIVFTLASMF